MGLLDYDLQLAKEAIKRFPGLLSEYAGTVNKNLRDKFASDEFDQKRAMRGLDAMAGGDLQQSRVQLDNAIAQKMVNVGLDLNPGAIGKIVWHGSPHKFNKFDMSKIGTGEGAQAYGHGLYMAESPDVARSYLKANGPGNDLTVTIGGKDVAFGSNISDMQLKAISLLEQGKKDAGQFPHNAAYYAKKRTDDPEIQKIIDEWKDAKIGYKDQSAMYKVDIPDEAVARFLDWDKPLSQQAPEVRAALQSQKVKETIAALKAKGELGDYSPEELARLRGEDYYDMLRQANGDSNIAPHDFLKSQGIPGIRYLDGGSRGTGQGTSNYVLFDDQMPRILEVNGQPTGMAPWNPGEWAGLLGK